MTPTSYLLGHLWLIPLYPLLTATLMLLIGRRLPKAAVSGLSVGSVGLSFLHAAGAVLGLLGAGADQRVAQQVLFEWVTPGPISTTAGHLVPFSADWGMLLDPLSSVMVLVVTGVGFLIHVYSVGYMAHEGGYYRFFGYLNLFMFAMLTLVLANNLLLMFVGWEGVGLCSYLLIGFYFLKKSAADAGKKAFIVNRIGDAGFLLGIFLTATTLGTIRFTSQGLRQSWQFTGILQSLGHGVLEGTVRSGMPVFTVIALLLFVGAMGKSAQIPLYVWLPDAMEGPTPVSALIHAATMVTAGVYMVARMNVVYQLAPMAMDVVAVVGAVTAIFAASMALVQTDIKKVLAYSTISQLGYMFLALGVGAFAAGIFHLMTHAFFKALLFLGAGSVIHALSGEQDVQKMGALWGKIPLTARTFAAATLAIAGIFPFAGFFSKDEILGHAFDRHPSLWLIGFLTAGMTAFYMFRLFFLTFRGNSRVPHEVEHHIHESPATMTTPLVILAVFSTIGGWIGWPSSLGGENRFERFLEPVLAGFTSETGAEKIAGRTPATEYLLMLASLAMAGAGIWLAYMFYLKKTELPKKLAVKWSAAYELVLHKYYVDEIYDALIVDRVKDLATALGQFDGNVVDGLGVDGTGWLARAASRASIWWDTWLVDGVVNLAAKTMQGFSFLVRLLQTGILSSYAMVILVGLVVLLAYYGHHMQVLLRSVR
jgi:NADH-quinone oxidoreductase subunit L